MEEITCQRERRCSMPDTTHSAESDNDAIGANLSRSFCANSDLFTHNLLGAPRDLPDEAYRERAEFFHSGDFI